MRSMLSHFSPDEPEKYIITVDRGYESYDLIFQCELKKLNYVFRLKAPSSSRSILSSFSSEIPDDLEEFDVTVKRFFTDKYNKIMKEQGDVYHYMNPYKTIPHFQKLLAGRHLHYLQFRVVKIKTAENTYACCFCHIFPVAQVCPSFFAKNQAISIVFSQLIA